MAPSTDWKEQIAPGEAEHFEKLGEILKGLQQKRARRSPISRGLHAKPQLSAEGSFTVAENLPEHVRAGLGAKPGTYRAVVRFSNGTNGRQPDKVPDVRGIAVKLIGVPGKKLIPGMENETTQDFLAILGTSTPFRNPDEFIWFVQNARSPATLPVKLIAKLGLGRGVWVLKKLLKSASRKVSSVATERFNSQLPFKWGPYAVRYLFDPLTPPDATAKPGTSANYLGEELAARLAKGAIAYDFKVQFFQDEQRTPIEDASVEWKEEDAPFFTVGRLTLPQQQVSGSSEKVEALSFDPWHALEEHRPLGAMNRARNAAYRLSTIERKAGKEPS
jgi:hypothetical protein